MSQCDTISRPTLCFDNYDVLSIIIFDVVSKLLCYPAFDLHFVGKEGLKLATEILIP